MNNFCHNQPYNADERCQISHWRQEDNTIVLTWFRLLSRGGSTRHPQISLKPRSLKQIAPGRRWLRTIWIGLRKTVSFNRIRQTVFRFWLLSLLYARRIRVTYKKTDDQNSEWKTKRGCIERSVDKKITMKSWGNCFSGCRVAQVRRQTTQTFNGRLRAFLLIFQQRRKQLRQEGVSTLLANFPKKNSNP